MVKMHIISIQTLLTLIRFINQYISSRFEAQINTGTMMNSLLSLVRHSGVNILNSIEVTSFDDSKGTVKVYTNQFEFETRKLIIATNGFANSASR